MNYLIYRQKSKPTNKDKVITNKVNYNLKQIVNPNIVKINKESSVLTPQNNVRYVNPTHNIIDLYNTINSNKHSNKTIIHVMDYSNGIGDFLRGSILLGTYCKYLNIYFKINVSKHTIFNCLDVESEELPENIIINSIINNYTNDYYNKLHLLINNFINSNEETLYITTNLFYNINNIKSLFNIDIIDNDIINKPITRDIKHYINSFLTFKQKYYDIARDLFNLKNYNVLHIRCNDKNFNTCFEDNNLLSEIIKLQLSKNTIVISNNYSLKRKINKLFRFYFIDTLSHHTGKVKDYTELESSIIDYIILSKSSNNYCFSYYPHGSGFSEQCSVLNNIPYRVGFLCDTTMTNDNIQLLLNHYNDLIEQITITQPIQNIDETSYNNISFITLTNTGYIDYTLNCLQSLKNINMKKQLKVYCIGEEGYSILKNKEIICELINDDNITLFQEFRTKEWSNVVYYKFEIIYNNLLNNEYVCITDGDIVYENNSIFNYLLSNIEDNDILIQSEGIYHPDLCSGFMFIKSNENTISLFNPKNIQQYRNTKGWGDQIYINSIKYNLKYKKLPLDLFPTGKYFYDYNTIIQPYIIHFNWVVGHEKKNKMIKYNKWYITNKIKICQHGTDGFGHQLEGMLRLLSLSLNNKADYQYNYDKEYIFQHSNFEINKLKKYLKEALKIISNNSEIIEKDIMNIILNEKRNFDEILKNDTNIENTIYLYDGVSDKSDLLPSNFEKNDEIEKSLPILRDAFVKKNIYLPSKSFDNKLINVCCHIRLGDAVGQRVLDNNNLFNIIKEFQKYNKYNIIIHTDGDVKHLERDNTIIYDAQTDVLQVLSDFIYADIIIINFTSLSIAAHLLADNTQNVICPTNAGIVFKDRILNKCITTAEFIKNFI